MKISLLTIASLSTISNVHSFGVLPQSSRCSLSLNMHFADEVEADSTSKESDAKKEQTVYDRLGFEEDKVAMGINANEVRKSTKLHSFSGFA